MRWFLDRLIKIAVGATLTVSPGVIAKVRIIETGEYKSICEEIRAIKETATAPMGGRAANGRERVYIIALAPSCLMPDRNRKTLEEVLTKRKGGGGGEKRTIKEIREEMGQKFGFDLGDDHQNVMVAWVDPGKLVTRETTMRKGDACPTRERVFSTRALMPMVSDWHNSGTISVANDKSRGQHCYLAVAPHPHDVAPAERRRRPPELVC